MTTNHKSKTLLDLLKKTSAYFQEKGIENPRLNAERLLSHVLKIERLQLYLQFEKLLSRDETDLLRDLVIRRGRHEPLQYLTGETEFMGLLFHLTPTVLIPRPETELLVERVLRLKQDLKNDQPVIWDIGTGSGCIAVSIAKYWPESRIIASDIDEKILEIAKKNAQANKVEQQILFIKHDILKEMTPLIQAPHIIVSNPPYVSNEEFVDLPKEVKNFEPRSALTDNQNGLQFYHSIISLIHKEAQCNFILLELSGTQTNNILKIIQDSNLSNFEVYDDLNGIPRVLSIKKE